MRDLAIRQGIVYRSLGAAVAGVIKTSPGSILALSCVNLNADNLRYFQIHNLATAPTAGAVPFMSDPVFNSSGLLVLDNRFFGEYGIELSTGISFGFSTTALTYTPATATDAIIRVRYV